MVFLVVFSFYFTASIYSIQNRYFENIHLMFNAKRCVPLLIQLHRSIVVEIPYMRYMGICTPTQTQPQHRSYKMLPIFIVFAFYLQTSKSTNEKKSFFQTCCLHSLSLSNRSDKRNKIVEHTCAHKCNRLMVKLYRSEQNKL